VKYLPITTNINHSIENTATSKYSSAWPFTSVAYHGETIDGLGGKVWYFQSNFVNWMYPANRGMSEISFSSPPASKSSTVQLVTSDNIEAITAPAATSDHYEVVHSQQLKSHPDSLYNSSVVRVYRRNNLILKRKHNINLKQTYYVRIWIKVFFYINSIVTSHALNNHFQVSLIKQIETIDNNWRTLNIFWNN